MNAIEVLTAWKACATGIDEVREAGSMRAAWETSTSRANMMWLLGRLHIEGKMSRQRLVRVALRCAETVAHKMPPTCLPLLADVSAWANGDESIDLNAPNAALAEFRRKAWPDDAAAATYDAYDAYAAAATAAYAYAAAATYAATAATADAYAMCDVIRDEIDADEICAAMGVL